MPDTRASPYYSPEKKKLLTFSMTTRGCGFENEIMTVKCYMFSEIEAMLFLFPAVMICLTSGEFRCVSVP